MVLFAGYGAPRRRRSTQETFTRMLILYTLTVLSIHYGISAHVKRNAGTLSTPAGKPRALPSRPGTSRHVGTGTGVRPPAPFCVDRIAAYYAPKWTQPRQEDFAFLMHASRTWNAAAKSSLLLVFTDPHSHLQLERTCQVYAKCRFQSAPSFPRNHTTAAYLQFAEVLRKSLPTVEGCSIAGVLIYAPGDDQRGASLDSRVLYTHKNTTTCLDANPGPCMVFSW